MIKTKILRTTCIIKKEGINDSNKYKIHYNGEDLIVDNKKFIIDSIVNEDSIDLEQVYKFLSKNEVDIQNTEILDSPL